jgi:pSer/pThr/pTyr-binding forkhead associated (FHA) protein
MGVKLVVTNGTAKGRVIPLPATVFMIGRGRKCHLRPHSLAVSKLHCAIACWAGKVVIRDLKSANGTFLNGERIQGEARVQDGDTLRVGTLEFTFRIENDPDAELPVQIVHLGDVKWLLETTDEPPLLETSDAIPLPETNGKPGQEDISTPPNAAETGDSNVLSAGEYLQEYLRKRKHLR